MSDTAESIPVENPDPAREGAETPPSPPWGSNAKIAVASGMALALLLIAYMIRSVFVTAALAGFIAFLLAPLIRFVQQKLKIRKWIALVATYFLVLLATLFFGFLLVAAIVQSVRALDPVGSAVAVADWVKDNVEELRSVSLFGLEFEMNELVDSVQGSLDTQEIEESSGITLSTDQLEAVLGGALATLRTAAGVATAIVMSTLVTLIVAMYLNADSQKFHAAVERLVPQGYERDAHEMSAQLKGVWTGFLYGQLINSFITGTLVFLALWAVGMPGAFVMGTIMMVLNMIPTFGPILAAIPGILAALVNGTTRFDISNVAFALIVAGIYLIVVQLQANLIAPRIMGNAVRLPPAVIMLGLIAGFGVGGLLGSLLAVPVIATLRDIFGYLYAKLIDRNPFPEDPDGEPPDDSTSEMAAVAKPADGSASPDPA